MIWTLPWNTVIARLVANKTARETERHEMDAHVKKVFGADRTTNLGNIQDHAPYTQRDSCDVLGWC